MTRKAYEKALRELQVEPCALQDRVEERAYDDDRATLKGRRCVPSTY